MIPVLKMLKQKDFQFEASLGYVVSSNLAIAIERTCLNPPLILSKKNQKTNKNQHTKNYSRYL
jgi:hypothetical protein